jgi:hypothetical protein
MKDGTTRLAYKAEHAVDVASDLIVAAVIHPADRSDHETVAETVAEAQVNAEAAGVKEPAREVVGDKGYHSAETVAGFTAAGVRTYIPEPKTSGGRRRWQNKPAEQKQAVLSNRRRMRGARGKRLSRQRSEKVERSFAHTCETGGGRRARVRGRTEVAKRHLIQGSAYNLGVVMRALFGVGTPRSLQGSLALACALVVAIGRGLCDQLCHFYPPFRSRSRVPWFGPFSIEQLLPIRKVARSSTGC